MTDKELFVFAALITAIAVTLYWLTDFKSDQSSLKLDSVTPENVAKPFGWFAEHVTTPPAPSPLDIPCAMLVECFTFIKGKLPTSFMLLIEQLIGKVSSTYVEFVGVITDWHADFTILTNRISTAYMYLVGPYHSWALEYIMVASSKVAGIPMQLFGFSYDCSLKLLNWCLPHFNSAVSEFVNYMIWYHESVSMGQLAVAIPTVIRLLLKTRPVFLTNYQNACPWNLYGPITETELLKIMDPKTKEWFIFERKNTKNGLDWLKVNHLPLVKANLAPAAWERKTSYLLTRSRYPKWMVGTDNAMWRYILTQNSVWRSFYDTRLTVSPEGVLKLACSLRTGATRFESPKFGSYKDMYILNSHTNTKVIKYISGITGIVFGNPPGEAGITGSVQSGLRIGSHYVPTPALVPSDFVPISTSRFTGSRATWVDLLPPITHVCDLEDRPDRTIKPVWLRLFWWKIL